MTEVEHSLTDFVIHRTRRGLRLWFDVFEQPWSPPTLNRASLTDGDSCFSLDFFPKLSDKSNALAALDYDGQSFSVQGVLRHDSRTTLSSSEFQKLISRATEEFKELPDSEKMDQKVALLTMEVKYNEERNKLLDWKDTVCRDLLGEIRSCPRYNGTYADDPDFEIVTEAGIDWMQIELSSRTEASNIEAYLSRFLANFGISANARRYHATELLQSQFGITRIGVLARRF